MGANYTLAVPKVTAVGSTTKSLWIIKPVSRFSIFDLDISMDGSAAAAGVQFDVYKVASGTAQAGTAQTPVKMDDSTQAAATTALVTITTEPTTVTVVKSWYLNPFGGLFPLQLPLGREFVGVAAGASWGLRYITPASTTPDILCNVSWEE